MFESVNELIRKCEETETPFLLNEKNDRVYWTAKDFASWVAIRLKASLPVLAQESEAQVAAAVLAEAEWWSTHPCTYGCEVCRERLAAHRAAAGKGVSDG